MIINCPVCGKLTCIHWPEHWVYRRGSAYYCSDLCMDAAMVKDMNAINEAVKRRKELAMTKITLEQKKKAVEIAVSGVNPLEYLKKCGSRKPNVLWYAIKENLKKVDPETYAKIPDFRQKPKTASEAMANMKDAADTFFSQCDEMGLNLGKDEPEATPPTVKLDGAIRIETPESKKVEIVKAPEKHERSDLQSGKLDIALISRVLADFEVQYRKLDGHMVAFSDDFSQPLELKKSEWISLCKEIQTAIDQLGVEL